MQSQISHHTSQTPQVTNHTNHSPHLSHLKSITPPHNRLQHTLFIVQVTPHKSHASHTQGWAFVSCVVMRGARAGCGLHVGKGQHAAGKCKGLPPAVWRTPHAHNTAGTRGPCACASNATFGEFIRGFSRNLADPVRTHSIVCVAGHFPVLRCFCRPTVPCAPMHCKMVPFDIIFTTVCVVFMWCLMSELGFEGGCQCLGLRRVWGLYGGPTSPSCAISGPWDDQLLQFGWRRAVAPCPTGFDHGIVVIFVRSLSNSSSPQGSHSQSSFSFSSVISS